METGVVHYGLGPIGLSLALLVARRPGLHSRVAIDVDPALHGKGLSEVLGLSTTPSPPIVERLTQADLRGATVSLHSTGSSLRAVLPQLLELIDHGLHVVSTCEELSWVERDTPAARELDQRARDRGVAVLGTGVNPGFVMDYLPIVLSGVTSDVRDVRVVRVQDAARRRIPLQRKVGAGLEVEEFRKLAAAGRLGHVGLRQSATAIAAALRWSTTRYEEHLDPVVGDVATMSEVGNIAAGQVLGLRQRARLEAAGGQSIDLDLTIAVGAPSIDRVVLAGDQSIEIVVPGGLHGDSATAAIVVNSIPGLLAARPGLRTMADMPPPRPWAAWG
jgi:4-hydroxy-tetrahydrodipicolinate reductase